MKHRSLVHQAVYAGEASREFPVGQEFDLAEPFLGGRLSDHLHTGPEYFAPVEAAPAQPAPFATPEAAAAAEAEEESR